MMTPGRDVVLREGTCCLGKGQDGVDSLNALAGCTGWPPARGARGGHGGGERRIVLLEEGGAVMTVRVGPERGRDPFSIAWSLSTAACVLE